MPNRNSTAPMSHISSASRILLAYGDSPYATNVKYTPTGDEGL